jgi:HK97 family phage major capsid protein
MLTIESATQKLNDAKAVYQSEYAKTTTPITDDDARRLMPLAENVKSAQRQLDRLKGDDGTGHALDFLKGDGATAAFAFRGARGSALIQQITGSSFGKFLTENRGRLQKTGPAWHTPELHLEGFGGGDPFQATTITEDPGTGGVLPPADYLPGIVPLPMRALVVADLMGSGTAGSNIVTYNAETANTNAAAPVAEGGIKPESSITFTPTNEPVRKIATWLPCTEEIVEDVPGFSSYINGRLRQFVLLAEDDQLLNGDGVAPNFTGILHRAGLAAPIARVDPENNADAILRQISAIETATQMPVSGVILHPTNWDSLQLLKDTTGVYIAGGGPFASPTTKTLWGRQVAVTPKQAIGTATVGAFRTGSEFRRRTPVHVVTSNSHADFFIRNLIAVVAEERGALVVFRPAAFGLVTALT